MKVAVVEVFVTGVQRQMAVKEAVLTQELNLIIVQHIPGTAHPKTARIMAAQEVGALPNKYYFR